MPSWGRSGSGSFECCPDSVLVDVLRWSGCPQELHPSFDGCPVAFPVVARRAAAGEVLPGVLTAAGLREDMVDRVAVLTAVAAGVPVPLAHTFERAGRVEARIGHVAVLDESDDLRHRDRHRRRVDSYRVVLLDDLSVAAAHQSYGALPVDARQDLV